MRLLECGVYSTIHDYGQRLSAEGGDTGRMADGGPPKARFGKRDQERDGLETPFPSMNDNSTPQEWHHGRWELEPN
jgi:hypothetical protein